MRKHNHDLGQTKVSRRDERLEEIILRVVAELREGDLGSGEDDRLGQVLHHEAECLPTKHGTRGRGA